MTREPDFSELVGEDLPAGERERLRRVHDLLVAAGPPPDLPATLSRPPDVAPPARRRLQVALALAAALAGAAFVLGYFLGDRGGGFSAAHSVSMHGVGPVAVAAAVLEIGERDEDGNWPLLLTVRGLRPLPEGGRYELYLTRAGRPAASCGVFRAGADETQVQMSVPYELRTFDGWVVRAHMPDGRAWTALST